MARAPHPVALLAVLIGCGTPISPPDHPPPANAHPPPASAGAARPAHAGLLAALGEDAPAAFLTEPRVLHAQLDGEGPMEAVLLGRVAGDTFGDHPFTPPEHGATDHLWVFRRTEDGWSVAGHRAFDATNDAGTLDYEAGVTSVRAEALLGPDHHVLVVTSEQGRGDVDPRWVRQLTELYGLEPSGLRRLFACATLDETVSGPARAGTRVTRQITLRAGPPPTIAVTGSTVEHGGVLDDESATSQPQRFAGDYRLGAEGFEPAGETEACE